MRSFLPFALPSIGQEEIDEVLDTLRKGWLTTGEKAQLFEERFKLYTGAPVALAVNSCTAALHLAYMSAGLKKGDEVITTPNSFVATSNMLLAVGAKPVFCDIHLDTYNIDEKKIEKLITKKTRAIVCVDFAGQPCEYDVLAKIAKRNKLILIADASHALGGRYKGHEVGSLADMTIFSFHPVKSVTTGEGGAVLTNNKKYYDKLKLLRNHGIYKDRAGRNVMVELGFNYRITDLQSALGTSQLKKLPGFMRARRQIVAWYERELGDFPDVILPKELNHNQSAWHIYVIRVKNSKLRDQLWQYLLKKGISANFHYPAIYSHPYYRNIGYRKIRLKSEEIYHATCLTLPCYPSLTRKIVRHIVLVTKDFFHAK